MPVLEFDERNHYQAPPFCLFWSYPIVKCVIFAFVFFIRTSGSNIVIQNFVTSITMIWHYNSYEPLGSVLYDFLDIENTDGKSSDILYFHIDNKGLWIANWTLY